MSADSRRSLGRMGEETARDYLERNGYRIIRRNYKISRGEIDIIAEKKKELHFIEVKTRKSDLFGAPEESVTAAKREKIRRTAQAFLSEFKSVSFKKHDIYLDVISVRVSPDENRIQHLIGAY